MENYILCDDYVTFSLKKKYFFAKEYDTAV